MNGGHDLVCVYKASNATKAEIVRTLLEGEGIQAVTADTSGPFSGLSVAPAEVFVQRTNEVAALEVIAGINDSDTNTDIDEEVATES
jgi:hypothetical protein